jgi:SAM-dependent methyltransferase
MGEMMNADWKRPLNYGSSNKTGLLNLHRRLQGMGYTPQGVSDLLGLRHSGELYPLDYRYLPLWLDRLESGTNPLSTSVCLLLLGLPEAEPDCRQALGAEGLELLAETGLLIQEQGTVHAALSLVPFENLLIATDKLFMNADPEVAMPGLSADNAVWRLDRTTLIMSKMIRNVKGQKALELGCGSGVLSLLAAGSCGQITGLDINPRAVNAAAFNAMLNDCGNADFTVSDLYRRVSDQEYDLIFMNPPSAPGLVRAWNREGGPTGREIVELAIKGAKEHLTENGTFQISFHAGYREPEDVRSWIKDYFPEDQFNTLISLNTQEHKAEDFALNEACQKAGPRDLELYRRTYLAYIGGLKAHSIERIAFAMLTAKRGGKGISIEKADLSSLN